MIIKAIHVKRYRCINEGSLPCDKLTALVGANGAGKSSFLRALDLFYNTAPRIDAKDFHGGETTAEVVCSVTFKDLTDDAKKLFASYIQGEELSVERVFTCKELKISSKYHGATLQHKAFEPIRAGLELKDRGKTARQAYDGIRAGPNYDTLPAWSTLPAVPEALREWEANHPGECTRQRDDGQFFGFEEVAQGYLGRFTRMLFIPAVRDASDDAAEGRDSALTGLMDLVVRSVLANREALRKLKEETQARFSEIVNPAKLTELSGLAERLTNTLQTFVPDSSIELKWLPLQDLEFPLPKADVGLVEDGYPSSVARAGHGLQRAFILTMLQHLALAQIPPDATLEPARDAAPAVPSTNRLPDLVFAIEEPELYQHPSRQRHFANILLQLARGKTPGVAERTQVLYSTHSPLFVGIDRIDQIRVLRKIGSPEKPKATRVVYTTSDSIAEILWKADGEAGDKYTGETLLPRLQSIMTPWMNEGFFSLVAVLVEGEDDRAALLGMMKVLGRDLDSTGISIIPCGGKVSMDRSAAIFRELGIPTYLIWDGDKGENDPKPEHNRRLLRLLGIDPVDWPCEISHKFPCFEHDLECTLWEEIGAGEFDGWLAECQETFRIPKKKHALKNPQVIASIIQKAEASGKHSESLKQICERVSALA